MKQAVKKVRMITMGIFALYTMGVPQITFAQAKNGDPIELKLISNIKNQPVFQLSLNNDEAAEYYIAIKDAGQNLLYSEKINGINLLRKYKLAIDESDLMDPAFGVNVEVTSAKTHKTEVYKIRTKSSLIQKIEVAKL